MLGARAHDIENGSLLERVGADGRAGHLPTDENQGNRVRRAVADGRDGVRRTGAGGDQGHADAPRGAGVSRRHESRALLVCGDDESNFVHGFTPFVVVENRVVSRKNRASAVSEDRVHALISQHLDEYLAALHNGARGLVLFSTFD